MKVERKNGETFRVRNASLFVPKPEYILYSRMTNSRRKNKHPKRAENVKTVVVTSGEKREEEGEGEDEDVERLRRMLMCVPCGVEQNHQMRKEETGAIIAKGVKRKRGQHECDVCEKVFGYPSDLARHKHTHTNERLYECDECGKRFTQSGQMKVHMRIHTNEKPYECDVCKKRYRHSGSLKHHMRTQH